MRCRSTGAVADSRGRRSSSLPIMTRSRPYAAARPTSAPPTGQSLSAGLVPGFATRRIARRLSNGLVEPANRVRTYSCRRRSRAATKTSRSYSSRCAGSSSHSLAATTKGSNPWGGPGRSRGPTGRRPPRTAACPRGAPPQPMRRQACSTRSRPPRHDRFPLRVISLQRTSRVARGPAPREVSAIGGE